MFIKQGRQFPYNVTVRRFRATTVVVDKQKYYIYYHIPTNALII
jgi:hypothetical protein